VAARRLADVPGGRRLRPALTAAVLAAAVVAGLVGCGAPGDGGWGTAAPVGDAEAAGGAATRAATASPPPAGVSEAVAGFRSPREVTAPAEPVRVTIPEIGVDARVGPVAQNPDGTVEVPGRWEDVGWYSPGPRPGQDGPAVLLGHVDSRAGPAVFADLARLGPGDAVEVHGGDGVVRTFTVTRLARFPKDRFPTEEVYLPTLARELRLVTCGGAFDRATRHYLDNVIAYAVLDG
jgi:hypothetical protein